MMSQAQLTDLVAIHVSWAGRRDLPLASLGVLVHHGCCVVSLTQESSVILSNPQYFQQGRRGTTSGSEGSNQERVAIYLRCTQLRAQTNTARATNVIMYCLFGLGLRAFSTCLSFLIDIRCSSSSITVHGTVMILHRCSYVN